MAGSISKLPPDGRTIPANGLEIYYREQGEGQALILLHGATDTHRLWDPFLPALRQRYRVITPDSRGHGRTVNPAPELSYRMLADDLAGFIHSLDLDNPFVLGYSDGGQAVLDFGMRYPDLASALVVGGVWYRMTKSYQDAIAAAGFPSPGEVDYAAYERQAPLDWMERLRRAHRDPRPDYPRILLAQLSRLWWTPLDYTENDFRKITAPILILLGERDEMIPLQQAEDLAALIPGSELRIIPGASHNEVLHPEGDGFRWILDFFNRQSNSG